MFLPIGDGSRGLVPRGTWRNYAPPPPMKREDTIGKSLGIHLGQSETWQYKIKKTVNTTMGKWGKGVSRKWGKKKKTLKTKRGNWRKCGSGKSGKIE